MRFSAVLVTTTFICTAIAQNQASLSAFDSAYQTYLESLETDQPFLQAISSIATDSSLVSKLEQLATADPGPDTLTAPPAYFSELPSSLLPIFNSVYSKEVSLANEYGLISGAMTLTTSILPAIISNTGSLPSNIPLTLSTDTQSFQPQTASSPQTTQSTTIASSVTSSTSTGSVTIATSTPTSSTSSSSDLPDSTKIGLGVGLGGIGGVLVLAAILIWWLMRKRKLAAPNILKPESQPGTVVDSEPGVAVSETDGAGVFLR